MQSMQRRIPITAQTATNFQTKVLNRLNMKWFEHSKFMEIPAAIYINVPLRI